MYHEIYMTGDPYTCVFVFNLLCLYYFVRYKEWCLWCVFHLNMFNVTKWHANMENKRQKKIRFIPNSCDSDVILFLSSINMSSLAWTDKTQQTVKQKYNSKVSKTAKQWKKFTPRAMFSKIVISRWFRAFVILKSTLLILSLSRKMKHSIQNMFVFERELYKIKSLLFTISKL